MTFEEDGLSVGVVRSEREKSLPKEEVRPRDERRGSRSKYSSALQALLPYRKESSKMKRLLPSGHAGLFSFVSFTWMTPIMWKALRVGLNPSDLWDLHEIDKAEGNAKRLTRIWEDEKVLQKEKASFMKAVWKFGKTRFYLCALLMILSICFQFAGPSWILKAVLNYQEDLSQPLETGLFLAFLALFAQFMRNWIFSAVWSIGIHTGMRVEGAMQYMTYDKMLRLRSTGDNVLSKAITFCTSDQERIFECVSGGVFAVAAPVMFIFCITYTCIVLGPWALLGNLVIFLFYPVMGSIARKTAMIRRKAVKYTNKRVGLMTEILNSIRLIKMYGWEDSFLKNVQEIRDCEESLLRTAAFLQSITASITPMINICAAIVVYLAYSLAGNNLTAAEAFTIFSVFSAMSFTFGTLPFALRAIGEASVCFRNFQKYLDLPEFENITEPNVECEHDAVIAIQNGTFAWEIEKVEPVVEVAEPKKPKRKPSRTDSGKAKPNGNGVAVKQDSSPSEAEGLTSGSAEESSPVVLEVFLKNINLEVRRDSLVGVCGVVGSGKSALLSAVLGEMAKVTGKILIRGSLAVVSQQAWIYSDSVQENILFGSPMNKEKYEKVLEICCLRPDIASFSNGDLTLIGERGVNLSGGQKQRINLARAVYADKSIYLMDDPLSSVDTVVAEEIFKKCLKGHLHDKTVILVSSGIQFLQRCDSIIFMKDGEIVEKGSHAELVAKHSYYFNMLQYHQQKQSEEDSVPLLRQDSIQAPVHESPKKKLKAAETFTQKIIEDNSEYKFAGIKAYMHYIRAAGGFLLFCLLLMFFLLFGSAQHSSQIWIRIWLDAGDGKMEDRRQNVTEVDGEGENMDQADQGNATLTDQELRGFVNDNPLLWMYQTVLIGIVVVSLLIGFVKGFMSSRFVLRGASNLHGKMLRKIVKSPMRFFDETPMGKITNRFSKDMDELDARLPFFFEFVIQSVIYVLLALILIAVIYPFFAFGMLIILAAMVFLDLWLNIGVREARKLESVLKTPVIHHLQSSSSGLPIIRTFHREDPFKLRFSSYLNRHLAAETVYRSANRWFTFRMDCVGMITVFLVILLAVVYRGTVSPALVGLALSVIYAVCTFIPFVMRMKSELQARFLSVERVLEYAEDIEEEEPESKVVIKPKDDWPLVPEIKFESVSLQYSADGPSVIKDLSFTISAGEKIGVVGRTGAGKTSVIASLLRLYPIEEGKILVGDVDISEISVKDLRLAIAIIPQDPILFQGTLRYNLDPFGQHSDEDIWKALEKSHIKAKIEREEKKLLQQVSSDGENFSVGEKQLICLTRALLRKNKILLLDEATSSLDIETDFLIQRTIRDAFKECTVITIAHRLNTIAFYDRILVMDKGELLEMDTPQHLMDNKNSRFHQMMKASGITSLDQLKTYTEPSPPSNVE